MTSFDLLYYDLNVLSKSVAYHNLSAASLHVGLSQPQLSRIIKKIEDDLRVVLLERGSKRKSAWTPTAFKLAETFLKTSAQLSRSIELLVSPEQTRELKIGTLEGLADIALSLSEKLLKNIAVEKIELNIYDLGELEDLFLKGHYDLIFTSREPTHQKYQYELLLGYQTMAHVSTDKDLKVLSPFEYQTMKSKRKKSRYFISNSLVLRKKWLESFQGSGVIPSAIKKTASADSHSVFMLGAETLSPHMWKTISAAHLEE